MAEFKRINVTTAHQMWQQGETRFVDIRDERSFAAAHIPGSQRLTDANLQDFLNGLDDDNPVVVVCYHGNSSQGAAQYLVNQGVENTSSLDGGMTAWAQQFPEAVERG
ncbi:thiosulfate sulfurtransferase GlpE [Pseudidiomarina donghaiensis]|uniref:Thiosulfate sulfurtransferase GlpE n=1 Tax=Pseudidiomarina donghaiensis TaxID=519452 RepID=A0A432XK02_9GAMM|nr:thiosulfate sulfurtransferase GlpE [Pseudidiomarina donghaiensis]RUO49040.1 thiosulfate sulfurtransferase GlpE [Pseudidiomarina donghaiensis]SFV20523.1 thiosulfate sulfurtransferase [Pseudidiomarina donghaiensis]